MSIPDYQTLMLPVLKTAGDNEEHRIGDVVERLARDFGLSDDERRQLLPSGKQSTFSNRVHWAKSYLVQARLLKATKRGHFQITDRGRTVLTKGVARIDAEYLAQFPEFIQFRERNRIATGAPNETVAEVGIVPAQVQTQTPDEILRATVRQIETALRKEIFLIEFSLRLLRSLRGLYQASWNLTPLGVMARQERATQVIPTPRVKFDANSCFRSYISCGSPGRPALGGP